MREFAVIEQVLTARSWRDLGLAKDKGSLRTLQFNLHPDRCADPRASDAFARLSDLFNAPDYDRRVATGTKGNGYIDWTMKTGFEDRSKTAINISKKLPKDTISFFAPVDSNMRTTYGDGWYFISDFDKFDSRTAVWLAKRLAAAAHTLEIHSVVHANINPDTVVINPEVHGLKLDGWWHAVSAGERIVLKPEAKTPSNFLGGTPASSNLDVAQFSAMLCEKTDADDKLVNIFKRNALTPSKPIEFFREVDKTAGELYGKKWHPLEVPNNIQPI